jgi:hypothetical protein
MFSDFDLSSFSSLVTFFPSPQQGGRYVVRVASRPYKGPELLLGNDRSVFVSFFIPFPPRILQAS